MSKTRQRRYGQHEIIDEARIRGFARSADWVWACYQNQKQSSKFGAINLIDNAACSCYYFIMNRMHTAKRRMSEHTGEDIVPGTPAERIGLVWPLTREVACLSRRHDVERRLQRHVAGLGRREG